MRKLSRERLRFSERRHFDIAGLNFNYEGTGQKALARWVLFAGADDQAARGERCPVR
jgi:hypothetical protein